MRIIIFENEANFQKKVCHCIEETTHHKVDLATDQWSALSQSYGEERTLYFLDIMVKDEPQGIAFAQWLLQQSDRHLIVFITNFMDKILGKTYLQVNAFNVIYKQSPHVMEQIIDTIDLAQAHINRQTLVIENRIENCILPFEDIHWIQAIKQTNKVLIHTEKGNYTYVDSLKKIFSRLDRRFVYANRSDIVNRDKIRRVDKLQKQLILEDGSSCDYTISYALKSNLL